MNLIRSTFALLFASTLLSSATNIKLEERKPAQSENTEIYEVKNNEVMINDMMITLFAFHEKAVSVSYRNKTTEETKPRYTIRFYNPYGMMIGEKKIGSSAIISFGNSTYMEPGEVSSEKIYLENYPIDKILGNSNVERPDDLNKIKWMTLSNRSWVPKSK